MYWTENVWSNQLVLTKTDINPCDLETEDSNIAALHVYVKQVIFLDERRNRILQGYCGCMLRMWYWTQTLWCFNQPLLLPISCFYRLFSFGGGSIAASLACTILLLDPRNCMNVVRCSCILGGMLLDVIPPTNSRADSLSLRTAKKICYLSPTAFVDVGY